MSARNTGTGTPRTTRARLVRRCVTSLAAIVCAARGPWPAALAAQLDPSHDWRTLRTRHFAVHFTPPLEPMARRAAAVAERAYERLSRDLVPPRGPIDLVISDDVDYTNGYATPFPSNRIVIYANPPVTESALRLTNDWTELGITHELTHIFHLDRARGVWALGQRVFGRASFLFPNSYSPSWLTEGLAVYEETRLTGAGRVTGSEHAMIARASAVDHAFPALSDVSLASPRFPFGEAAYAYGSLFVDYLARTRGQASVRDFVERASAQLVPFWIDRPASRAFGITFRGAWVEFRDSVTRSVAGVGPEEAPLPGWRELTHDGVFVAFPRWLGDTALLYTGTPGRETRAAYRVGLDGRRTRLGRRNSSTPNVPAAGGGLLFSQEDFVSPYELRSDLFVQRGRRQVRLTRGARLSAPDTRADGAIVAMQVVPGGARLVRVSPDGRGVTPITAGTLDEQWTEPRWSHRGDRIAAIRWRRGGVSDVVVLDTTGAELRVLATGHSIQATPSWTPDDRAVLYTSDRSGTTQAYLADVDAPTRPEQAGGGRRLSTAVTGAFEPQLAPGGRAAAMVLFRADGYHLGVGRCCELVSTPDSLPPARAMPPAEPVISDSGRATAYSPWASLWPRYWLPAWEPGLHAGKPRLGATTSGTDVVGRHAFGATFEVPVDNSGLVAALAYGYRGLGLPILNLFASQDWEIYSYVRTRRDPADTLGELRRRVDEGEVTATWLRQRVRSFAAFTAGGGVEQQYFAGLPRPGVALPRPLIQLVDTTGRFNTAYYPRAVVAASFSNAQRPAFSISPEDGLGLAVTARERVRAWRGGSASLTAIGAGSAYKSLDLPGFAHHVVALHAVGGVADQRATSYFEVGGTSGSRFELVPGYTLGEGRRDFGVRGFAPATLVGTRAFAGSAEYRLPLRPGGRGLGPLPVFLARSSLSLFGDAGTAFCPAVLRTGPLCTPDIDFLAVRHWISSAGAELNVNAAVLSWDAPYRFRLGIARPLKNPKLRGLPRAASVSTYLAVGLPF